MSAESPSSAVSEPSSPVYNLSDSERFVEVLENLRGQRSRGFLVLVGGNSSLSGLQALCQDPNRVSKKCLTARYRLEGGTGFGTLLAALHSDLWAARIAGPGDVLKPGGQFLPQLEPLGAGPGPWSAFRESSGFNEFPGFPPGSSGSLRQELVHKILSGFESERILTPGSRLVLFLELTYSAGPEEQWANEARVLLESLPGRVGVVVSGAPDGLARSLDPEDPHLAVLARGVEPDASTETEGVLQYLDSALSGDQPADRDRLNVAGYADALARLILLPETHPITVGIHAPWGRGKSSFLKFIGHSLVRRSPVNRANGLSARLAELEAEMVDLERQLELDEDIVDEEFSKRLAARDNERRDLLHRMERAARRDVVLVQFNAWRYENATQIWAGLASEISRSFEASLSWPGRQRSRIRYAFWRSGLETWMRFLVPGLAALAIAGLLWFAGSRQVTAQLVPQLPDWARLVDRVVPAAALVLTLLFLAERFYKVVQPVSQRVFDYLHAPDYEAQTGPQNRVIQDLAFLRGRVARRAEGRAGPRGTDPSVVVFIDDLDRCSEDKVMEILQAINLILGASDFFVFLALDTEMIYRAIAKHYELEHVDPLVAQEFAESYLRKILQLSFHLPETIPAQRLQYVAKLFSAASRREFASRDQQSGNRRPSEKGPPGGFGLAEGPFSFDLGRLRASRETVLREVDDTVDELLAFSELAEFIDENPRELKRLVNVHRLMKILLQRADNPPTPARQRKLVAWLVFCARWGDLIDDALGCAARDAQSPDVFQSLLKTVDVGPDRQQLSDFATLVAKKGPIAAADLAAGSALAEAARVSRLVRDVPAPASASAVAAEPEPVAKRNGSSRKAAGRRALSAPTPSKSPGGVG